MKVTISTILLIVALICFVLAALGIGAGRLNLVAAGLAAWVLASLIPS